MEIIDIYVEFQDKQNATDRLMVAYRELEDYMVFPISYIEMLRYLGYVVEAKEVNAGRDMEVIGWYVDGEYCDTLEDHELTNEELNKLAKWQTTKKKQSQK